MQALIYLFTHPLLNNYRLNGNGLQRLNNPWLFTHRSQHKRHVEGAFSVSLRVTAMRAELVHYGRS
jgi:hypothetical protein